MFVEAEPELEVEGVRRAEEDTLGDKIHSAADNAVQPEKHNGKTANLTNFVTKSCEQQKESPKGNFQTSMEQSDRCQAEAIIWARGDTEASTIIAAHAWNAECPVEEQYDHFGRTARFQLQMRQRNKITYIPQTQAWCID